MGSFPWSASHQFNWLTRGSKSQPLVVVRCSEEVEDCNHALWRYPIAQAVWSSCTIRPVLSKILNGSLEQILFPYRRVECTEPLDRASRLLVDFQRYHRVDAAVRSSQNPVGVRIAAEDHGGSLVAAVGPQIDNAFLPHIAECLALSEGAWFIQKLGYRHWVLENDALNAVQSPAIRAPEAPIISDFVDILSSANGGSARYVLRLGNTVWQTLLFHKGFAVA